LFTTFTVIFIGLVLAKKVEFLLKKVEFLLKKFYFEVGFIGLPKTVKPKFLFPTLKDHIFVHICVNTFSKGSY
jgi:hypothetical protein